MRVAIVHYHFDRGGVSRVVETTLGAFRDSPSLEFGLLSGRPVEGLEAPCGILPGLDYRGPGGGGPDAQTLSEEIRAEARRIFGGADPDVWHIHNPALGKNTAFCGLVSRLARDGQALLLHEHDFAEDFRPANFRLRESSRSENEPPFLFSPRVRFAVLNRRDADLLARAGFPPYSLIQLPNPIPASTEPVPCDPESNLILYPVRALARKNLGEFLLLAHAFGDEFRWQTTLPPTNRTYAKRFRQWCDLVTELSLPARLGVAAVEDRSLEERIAECRAVVTTSVAEGFGLSFLEPWTHGRPVFGRDLPEITSEFREMGIGLDSLYSKFPIPADAIDRGTVADGWHRNLESAYRSFGISAPKKELHQISDGIRQSTSVEFSLLDEDLQVEALRSIVARDIPILPPTLIPAPAPNEMNSLRERILESFHPASYAAKLERVYRTIANAPREDPSSIPPTAVLQEFLHPSRFHPHFVE